MKGSSERTVWETIAYFANNCPISVNRFHIDRQSGNAANFIGCEPVLLDLTRLNPLSGNSLEQDRRSVLSADDPYGQITSYPR